MKTRNDTVNTTLQQLLTRSEELSRLLQEGSADALLEKLSEREHLLIQLHELAAEGINLEKEQATIRRILELDKHNAEQLESRMNQTYESLTELINQRRSVSNLKSFSKSKPKQVIDLLF